MVSTEVKSVKLGMPRKLGYSVGQMTDSIGFNVFYFFFLFFLTDYVGIPPGIAGTISLIAVMWDAVTDPIIGHISDNLNSKYGRRRPLMLAAAVPYGICTFLLFNYVDLGESATFIYYAAIAILFWSCYKVFVIPFFALGAELTDDFNERTSLRAYASVLLYLAVMLASAAPPMILKITGDMGGSGIQGWNNVGIIFGALIIISALICWRATRGGELQNLEEKQENTEKENLIKNFVEVLKLKPTKALAISVFAWAVVSAFLSSGPVYLLSNNMQYSEERISTYFVFMTVMSIVWIPLVNYCSNKFDKRKAYYASMLISTIGFVIFGIIGFSNFAMLLIYVSIFAFGNCTFWTVYYSMMYDISELDEFVNGKRREGSISALMSFFQKLGSAICMWMIGMLLELGGYNGDVVVQTESAQNMILSINTFIPAVFGILAVVFGFIYPLSGKRFNALMTALQAKRKGETYSSEEFKELL